jgi:hypothetical protein
VRWFGPPVFSWSRFFVRTDFCSPVGTGVGLSFRSQTGLLVLDFLSRLSFLSVEFSVPADFLLSVKSTLSADFLKFAKCFCF